MIVPRTSALDATKTCAELLRKLAWPIVVLIGLVLFRHSITDSVRALLEGEEVKLSAAGFSIEIKTYRPDVAEQLSESVERTLEERSETPP